MADLNQIELPNGTTYNLSSYKLLSSDTRSDNQLPSWYMSNYPKCTVEEFKSCSTIGVNSIMSGTYCVLNTITPWTDSSGGRPVQIAVSDSGVRAQRVATADNTWGSWVKLPNSDTNTTYTFANGTNGFTVTPSGGSAQTITVTPSITNNVTGSGTSGYLTKFNGANTITNGPALGSDTTKYLRNDGTWAVPAGGGSSTLAGLSDVTITSAANNQKLAYNSTNSKWVNVSDVWEGTQAQYNALSSKDPNVEYFITDAPSTQTFTLAGLQDTSISQLSSGQFLKYDGGVWKNAYLDSSSLDDLTDVSLSSPSSNQFLKFNGTSWINSSLAAVATSGSFADLSNKPGVSALTDTTITSAANDQVLTYRNGNWINKSHIWEGTQAQYNALATHDPNVTYYITDAGEGTAERLNDLEDIDIVNPTNGQILLYNANNQTWENSSQNVDLAVTSVTATGSVTANAISANTVNGIKVPHQYSTTEHIVGYWIDGEPIYERTIKLPSGTSIASGGSMTVGSAYWNLPAKPIDIVTYRMDSAGYLVGRCLIASIDANGTLILYNTRTGGSLGCDAFVIQYIKIT